MKKKQKSLLIAAICLVVLVLVYVGVTKLVQTASDEATEETDNTLILTSMDSDQMTSIQYEKDGVAMSFTKEDGIWYDAQDKNFPVLQDSLTTLTNDLGAVTATRKLESPAELSEYGLDAPAMTVTFKDSSDQSITLSVGNTNDATSGCYVQLAGDDSVYVVEASFLDDFSTDIYTMADMEAYPTMTTDAITKLTVASDGKELQVWSDTAASGGWYASDGTTQTDDCSDSSVSALLGTVTGMSYASNVDYDCQDLSKYGLTDAAIVVKADYSEEVAVESDESDAASVDTASETEVTETGVTETEVAETEATETESETEAETVTVAKEMVLFIGNQDANGDYYACIEGSTQVHTISAASVASLTGMKLTDLLNTSITSESLSSLNGLTVTIDGTTTTYEKTEEIVDETETEASDESVAETADTSDESVAETADTSETEAAATQIVWYADGTAIETTDLSTAYSSLTGMTAEKILDQAVEPEGDATCSITMQLADGSSKIITFYSYDSNYQLVDIDGTAIKLVNKRDAESLIEAFSALI